MARKSRKAEQLKQELISSVPVNQRKMITQPITFTYLNGEMSMMQTRIQTMIMEKLQGRIAKALNRRLEQGFIGDLFTDDDFAPLPGGKTMYLTFEVKYSELGVEASHYEDVDVAARAMQRIIYEKEVTDEQGRCATEYTVVFDKVTIPNKDKGTGEVERRDSIKLRMLPETARDLFHIIPYQKYLKDAIFLFSSNYAGRIYLLINANKDLGTWACPYEKLRKILLTTYDKETGHATVDKYRDISDFKKRVLEPARREILEAADRIDCTFDYELRYPAGKKRGTPEYVVFHIHLTDIGRKARKMQLETKEQTDLRNLLTSIHLTTADANEFINQMKDRLDLLADKAREVQQLYADIKSGKRKMENPINNYHTYTLGVFRNFIASLTAEPAEAQEITGTTGSSTAGTTMQKW